jgi:hypothetical protein
MAYLPIRRNSVQTNDYSNNHISALTVQWQLSSLHLHSLGFQSAHLSPNQAPLFSRVLFFSALRKLIRTGLFRSTLFQIQAITPMMFDHRDALEDLNSHLPLKDKLVSAHRVIQQNLEFVARIAVTLFDSQTHVLKTYIDSSGEDNPLNNYQISLDQARSLKEILKKKRPRVVNNLITFEEGDQEHTRRIGRQGYAASYTMPMFHRRRIYRFPFLQFVSNQCVHRKDAQRTRCLWPFDRADGH